MERLIEIIFKHLSLKETVPDELMYEFLKATEEIIVSRSAENIPPEFWQFQNYVEMYWRGRKYEREESGRLIYQMGQLLSCVNMIQNMADSAEKVQSIKEYARRWSKKYQVFRAMHNEYGITHKHLAEKAGVSASSLSQFISRTKWDGYFTSRTVGREKYYYLTDQGEELYELLRDEIERPQAAIFSFDGIDNTYIAFQDSSVNMKKPRGLQVTQLKNSFS